PVRFIGNRSSGKQGYAIAAALAQAGADVTLVSGPVALPAPDGVRVVRVETAEQMLAACEAALPVDIAVCAAAVSDYAPYRIEKNKIKKDRNKTPQFIDLKENPDVLQRLSTPGAARPSLVVGFAAETEDLLDNAAAKRLKKGCDWLLANDVGSENIFGADENHVYLVTDSGIVEWERAGKRDVAERLVREICDFMNEEHHDRSDRNRPDAA
ncbi:MAG: bifunctional phosphopantothenoylcysteine decarboxylase/phosphopantothenate synthase, partial [Alphaproteobacteria bacterium]|nr:bifunctional phosphopantothenoylcysteine decarboxylase/phosphopantothenate synthase [Alphaproteobacteria bacterium]